ncbi:endonuclease domain-containing protein [bacterium]|nr:endonuclease domain-containing protein [bacterium]
MTNARAIELRKTMTESEKKLWYHLRLRQRDGCKFRRQHPLGPYVVDFVCLDKRLIIEVDGGQHAEQEGYDRERTAWLESAGFRVMRFWNNEILREMEAVLEQIDQTLTPLPASPSRGEEVEGQMP